MICSPEEVATAVCSVMGGASPSALLADHRGSPRTADLRAVAMYVWRLQHGKETPTFSATGEAFGRDRRNVALGVQRICLKRLPSPTELRDIKRRLGI